MGETFYRRRGDPISMRETFLKIAQIEFSGGILHFSQGRLCYGGGGLYLVTPVSHDGQKAETLARTCTHYHLR